MEGLPYLGAVFGHPGEVDHHRFLASALGPLPATAAKYCDARGELALRAEGGFLFAAFNSFRLVLFQDKATYKASSHGTCFL